MPDNQRASNTGAVNPLEREVINLRAELRGLHAMVEELREYVTPRNGQEIRALINAIHDEATSHVRNCHSESPVTPAHLDLTSPDGGRWRLHVNNDGIMEVNLQPGVQERLVPVRPVVGTAVSARVRNAHAALVQAVLENVPFYEEELQNAVTAYRGGVFTPLQVRRIMQAVNEQYVLACERERAADAVDADYAAENAADLVRAEAAGVIHPGVAVQERDMSQAERDRLVVVAAAHRYRGRRRGQHPPPTGPLPTTPVPDEEET